MIFTSTSNDIMVHKRARPDHGPVRTAGSDRNRGQKTEIGTEFTVPEPEPGPEPVNIRFRFGPRKSKPWTEPAVHGSMEVRAVRGRVGRFNGGSGGSSGSGGSMAVQGSRAVRAVQGQFGRFERFMGGSSGSVKKIFFFNNFFFQKKNRTWTVRTGPEPPGTGTATWTAQNTVQVRFL